MLNSKRLGPAQVAVVQAGVLLALVFVPPVPRLTGLLVIAAAGFVARIFFREPVVDRRFLRCSQSLLFLGLVAFLPSLYVAFFYGVTPAFFFVIQALSLARYHIDNGSIGVALFGASLLVAAFLLYAAIYALLARQIAVGMAQSGWRGRGVIVAAVFCGVLAMVAVSWPIYQSFHDGGARRAPVRLIQLLHTP